MRNPLNKRILRELKSDFLKYLAIFIFMIGLIGIVSGFLVVDDSFYAIYSEGFVKQNVEDGHFSFDQELSDEMIDEIETTADVTIYPYHYFEETLGDTEKNIRVYSLEREVNLLSLIDGELPDADGEIAMDRMFAQNNDIAIGDKITLKNSSFTITGLIASPDYSSLFESNSDMMFDSINFGISVLPEQVFSDFDTVHRTVNYVWKYPEVIDRLDKESAKNRSDNLVDDLEEVFTDYTDALIDRAMESGKLIMLDEALDDKIIEVKDYVPRYLNQAINFTGDDMGGDRTTIVIFSYIMILVLAFVFAATTSSTIAAEAGAIGTLRATGYSRGALIRHYMILPILVSLLAALIGNIIGYTVINDVVVDIYNASFSLAKYEQLPNKEAFILTTVVPLIIMILVNLLMLALKLRLSPLRFLRHDLSRKGKKKAFRLNTKIPFMHRFRMRIIFQNIPSYLVLVFGVFVGGLLMIFGTMFQPLLADYKDMVLEDRICDYQYILMEQKEIDNDSAEKFSMTSLSTVSEKFMEDDVSIYGISDDSRYVSASIGDDRIIVSSAMASKYGLEPGDLFTLKDPYNAKKTYDFTVDDVYAFETGIAVFTSIENYAELFDEDADYFTGYFSNEELTELDDDDVAAVITLDDLTKISDQLEISMGSMMGIIRGFAIITFILLMFLMSKQIIEKNASSISMTKILGFRNGEIGGLYLVATSIVVILALLVTIPLTDIALRFIFTEMLYEQMTGYIPYIISGQCYTIMFVTGLLCYIFIALCLMVKISQIPKSDALKGME